MAYNDVALMLIPVLLVSLLLVLLLPKQGYVPETTAEAAR
jgi:hypothetical protein